MDVSFDDFSWQDIYHHWESSMKAEYKKIVQPFLCCKINVNGNSQNRIYFHSWIEKKNLYKNTKDFKKVIELPMFQNDFSYFQSETRSAELMVQSKSEEERAAIWIYTFCKTVEDGNYPCPNNLLIEYVGAKARIFLQESFKEWLFKYNHKLPFSYIDSRMLKHVVFDNYKAVVDYAILNALMIRNEYVIALYDSEPNNDDIPFTYKNLRKNQLT